MNAIFDFTPGDTPILVSMPHSGTDVPESIFQRFSLKAKSLPDTDWHIPRLYTFIEKHRHSILKANYSRYVIDLNRPPDDQSLYPGQITTGLCPRMLFDDAPVYLSDQELSEAEISKRLETYWLPYHQKLRLELENIKSKFGYVLLYDAHSIASRVPGLFKGKLPDLNLGTANRQSCSGDIENVVAKIIRDSDYTSVVNGRFVGGYITRNYGDPDANIHAMQMELAQCCYMCETECHAYDREKAERLESVLAEIFDVLLEWRPAG